MIYDGAGYIGLAFGEEDGGGGGGGVSGWTYALTILIDTRVTSLGILPILINPRFDGSPDPLPIVINTTPSATSLPILINPRFAGTPTGLTILIPGDVTTAVAADALSWQPVVLLNGVDISSRVVGAVRIERGESEAPICELTYAPVAGAIDPLAFVSAPIVVGVRGVSPAAWTHTEFTGVVSSPAWDVTTRTLTLSATGDLQQQIDGMTKAEIDVQFPDGRFSEAVFGAADDLSGWDYAQALIDTTDLVLWQDAGGAIRTTSIAAKAVADYTWDESSIIDGTLEWQPAERTEIVNQVDIRTQHRFKRKRQRNVSCRFQPPELATPGYYLSGLYGGWALPQRSQIESAATSGGWTILGKITYRDVWPSGGYPIYSDEGVLIYTGWVNQPAITGEFAIGATWTAGRRWLQTVTEDVAITVSSPDSQAVVGKLATASLVTVESDADDPTWETSLEYTGTSWAAARELSSGDWAEDLDDTRTDLEDAQEVAVLVARNTILKSHRGSSVRCQLPYTAHLDLDHTVAIDTAWLTCKGKVRRLVHTFDIDGGAITTDVEIALSRRNGSGLATDTTVAAPAQPADPDETEPETRLDLRFYLGGMPSSRVYDEDWLGYLVNVPDLGRPERNPLLPEIKRRTYEVGFAVQYPEIDADYTDPYTAEDAATFDVLVPEDPLTLLA